jgi:hypothetical protein
MMSINHGVEACCFPKVEGLRGSVGPAWSTVARAGTHVPGISAAAQVQARGGGNVLYRAVRVRKAL